MPERYEGKVVFRPKIEVALKNKGKAIRLVMLVDSGADTSFLPLEVAELLELKLSEKTHISRSASGPFETKHALVQAEIRRDARLPIGTLRVTVPVSKMDEKYAMNYALLGRDPFFKKFDVPFRDGSRKLVLYPRKV